MNAERLLALYERVAEAPDAITRLRRFVLDLAVRGKLVLQDPNDEPASELLKRVIKERVARVGKGELRQAKGIAPPSPDAWLFEIPSKWEWIVADQLWDFENGDRSANYPSRDQLVSSGIPFINAGHLVGGRVSLTDMNYITPSKFRSLSGGKLRQGDQIYCLRGSLGKHAVFDLGCDAAIASSLVILRPVLADFVPYLSLYLDSDIAQTLLRRFDNGTAQPNLSSVNLRKYEIPLPPLAEQYRIVAKVDELMALCDRLEAARKDREAKRDRLSAASLARLNTPDPETFTADARFTLEALPALTTRPNQIKQLRQTILNLAVRGKLVPQDATDESAAFELQLVEELKAKQDLKKPKKVAPIEESERWCSTPKGWIWARWDQVTDWITYGFTRPMEHVDEGIPIVTGKNVAEGQIIFETASLTPKTSFDALNEKDKPKPGDILITKDGSIGRTAIVEERHLPFCINQSVAVMWLRSCHFDRRYLKLVLDSPQTQDKLLEKTAGVAIKHISITDLGKMVFPLPPLAEQHRIVAKVDELMALFDRLEASLTTSDQTRTRLLEATLIEALVSERISQRSTDK